VTAQSLEKECCTTVICLRAAHKRIGNVSTVNRGEFVELIEKLTSLVGVFLTGPERKLTDYPYSIPPADRLTDYGVLFARAIPMIKRYLTLTSLTSCCK